MGRRAPPAARAQRIAARRAPALAHVPRTGDAGRTADARITPIVLCGGAGAGLWPLSRAGRPAPFAAIEGGTTPLAATLRRLAGDGFAPPVLVTGAASRVLAAEEAAASGVDPAAILLEPEGRGTAPAILAAAVRAAERDPAALLLASPSDHAIPDTAGFRATVLAAAPAARAGRIVAFGVAAERADAAIDLPAHLHRAAHRIVVAGVAEVTAGEEARALAPGGSLLVPAGAALRPANPGEEDAVLIAVRTGVRLGEDDVVR